MAYDPTKPANNSSIVVTELRAQFNGLNDDLQQCALSIDAQQQFIAADHCELLNDRVMGAFGILPEEQGTENFFMDEPH